MAKNEYSKWHQSYREEASARCESMKDRSISGSHSPKTGIKQAEKAVYIFERVFITICLAAIFFFIISRYVPLSEEYGSTILFGGIAIIAIIIMVEALLLEKRRHQH